MFGSHLAQQMAAERRHEIVGIDLDKVSAPEGVRSVQGDVRDEELLRSAFHGTDVVVHGAAALPSYPADEIADIDVRGTRTVLAAAREAGAPRVVHVSSTAVYGLPTQVPTTEDFPFAPVDAYSRAKIDAELECRRARAGGLTVPVLRPKTFLGPRRLGLFAMLFQWADEGRHFPLMAGGRIRCQMLDVADLVEATRAAIDLPADCANTDLNLGATEFGTLADDFQAVLDDAGYGRRVRALPAWPAAPLLRGLASLDASPVYARLVGKLLHDSYVSTDRARRVLGFRPRRSNRDTILRTYRWWRENQHEIAHSPSGRTHRSPWRQGALGLVKHAF